MGRKRIRSDEENRVYDREYQKLYQSQRRNTEREYYKLTASRSYYRKVLRNMASDDKRYQHVSEKLQNLDEKVNEFLSNRDRYARLDICTKVNEKIGKL